MTTRKITAFLMCPAADGDASGGTPAASAASGGHIKKGAWVSAHEAALVGLADLLERSHEGAAPVAKQDDEEEPDDQSGGHGGLGDCLLLARRLAQHGPVRGRAQQLAAHPCQVFNVRAVLLWRAVQLPLADRVVAVDAVVAFVQLSHQGRLAASSLNCPVERSARGDVSG